MSNVSLLPKCPRCFCEPRVHFESVRDLDQVDPCDEFWVACTKCEFSGAPSTTREGAVKSWKYPHHAVEIPKREPVETDENAAQQQFQERLIGVLQDINKTLKTLVSRG